MEVMAELMVAGVELEMSLIAMVKVVVIKVLVLVEHMVEMVAIQLLAHRMEPIHLLGLMSIR